MACSRTLGAGTLGAQSGTITLTPEELNATGYDAALGPISIVVNETVVAAATGAVNPGTAHPNTIYLGAIRSGPVPSGTPTQAITLANTAAAGAAGLDVAVASLSGGAVASGNVSQLAPGRQLDRDQRRARHDHRRGQDGRGRPRLRVRHRQSHGPALHPGGDGDGHGLPRGPRAGRPGQRRGPHRRQRHPGADRHQRHPGERLFGGRRGLGGLRHRLLRASQERPATWPAARPTTTRSPCSFPWTRRAT